MQFSGIRKRRDGSARSKVSLRSTNAGLALAVMVAVAVGALSATTSSFVEAFTTAGGFARNRGVTSSPSSSSSLSMAPSSTLKPAATPLMDSGKALARSGELLIDLTDALGLYGGALSACGAQIRNAGDCLAQAAASCRFKTGIELVIDELREAATCLAEATDKLGLAADEAEADQNPELREMVAGLVGPTDLCSTKIEESGMRILMRESLFEVGGSMVEAAGALEDLSDRIKVLSERSDQNADGLLSAQRMRFAAERLEQAGIELRGEVDDSKKNQGRAFLKGGGF